VLKFLAMATEGDSRGDEVLPNEQDSAGREDSRPTGVVSDELFEPDMGRVQALIFENYESSTSRFRATSAGGRGEAASASSSAAAAAAGASGTRPQPGGAAAPAKKKARRTAQHLLRAVPGEKLAVILKIDEDGATEERCYVLGWGSQSTILGQAGPTVRFWRVPSQCLPDKTTAHLKALWGHQRAVVAADQHRFTDANFVAGTFARPQEFVRAGVPLPACDEPVFLVTGSSSTRAGRQGGKTAQPWMNQTVNAGMKEYLLKNVFWTVMDGRYNFYHIPPSEELEAATVEHSVVDVDTGGRLVGPLTSAELQETMQVSQLRPHCADAAELGVGRKQALKALESSLAASHQPIDPSRSLRVLTWAAQGQRPKASSRVTRAELSRRVPEFVACNGQRGATGWAALKGCNCGLQGDAQRALPAWLRGRTMCGLADRRPKPRAADHADR
jgi:hypothetical protein